jgi:hypothetical protein
MGCDKNEGTKRRLLKRIEEIKKEINGIGEMRVGSLTTQYNVCGNPNCACKAPENPRKHGPYHQLSYTRYGKSTSEFVKSEDVEATRRRLEDYKLFMELKDEWIDISIQLARLRKGLDVKAPIRAKVRKGGKQGGNRRGATG